MRRLLAGSLLTLALVSAPHPGQAQASGVAFVTYGTGSLFEGWIGPWRSTAEGLDVLYIAVCIKTTDPVVKLPTEVVASIPNGSDLSEIRVIVTDAVQARCETVVGVTIPAAAVFLPAIQPGL